MAMNNVQKNVATAIQDLAEELLAVKNRLAIIVAMYTTEGMTSLTDADLQELAEFAHVTVAELTAAKNALGEVNTALGEYVAGTAATRLMKVVRKVPE